MRIVNAREHNLKALDVDIPHGKFNVITGVSGSGQKKKKKKERKKEKEKKKRSTLAFDILFHEGQRRYLESLNAYARSIVQPAGRPEVDAVYGIPPTVAIEQRSPRGGRKSTVATTSEVWHFLRLLYVKLGLQHCIHDGTPVTSQSVESIAAQLLRDHKGQHVGFLAPLVVNRKGVYTDLGEVGQGARQYASAGWTANSCRSTRGRSLDRFREHTIELPVADLGGIGGRRSATASRARPDARNRQGRDASACAARRLGPRDERRAAHRETRRRESAVHQARVSGVRHELSGARPAHVLV